MGDRVSNEVGGKFLVREDGAVHDGMGVKGPLRYEYRSGWQWWTAKHVDCGTDIE